MSAQHADGNGRGATLDLGPLDSVFLEAALAADSIMALRFLHISTVSALISTFSQNAYRCHSFVPNLLVLKVKPTRSTRNVF